MAALREVFVSFGVEFDSTPLERGAKRTEQLTGQLTQAVPQLEKTQDRTTKVVGALAGLASILGAGAIVRGLNNLVQSTVDNTLQMSDTARQLGTTSQAMREWQYVAEQSGVPVETMNSALQTLSQNMRSVQLGNGDMATAFRRLHVPVRDAQRNLRDASDVFAEAGVAITRIENPTRRARLATQVFGEAGRHLVPIFEQGATAINEMRDEVRALLGGNLQEMEQQSRRVRAEYSRFNLSLEALTNSIVLQLLPGFRWMVQGVTSVVLALKKWTDENNIIQAFLTAGIPVLIALFYQLGTAMLAAFGPALLAIAPYAAAFAVITFVVDDLIALFNGGGSAIGRFLDAMFGVGTARQVVVDLRDAYEGFFLWLDNAIDGLVRTLQRIPGVGRLLNSLGVTGAPDVVRQTTRGFIAPGAVGVSDTPRVLQPRGFIAPGTVAALRSGGPRNQDVRISTQVGNIIVEGSGNPEQVAETIQNRLRDQSSSAARNARAALVRSVQTPDSEV